MFSNQIHLFLKSLYILSESTLLRGGPSECGREGNVILKVTYESFKFYFHVRWGLLNPPLTTLFKRVGQKFIAAIFM